MTKKVNDTKEEKPRATEFDYGVENVVDATGDFKLASEGSHMSRIKALVHLGTFQETFKGKKKKPAPEACIVFELLEEDDFEEDGVTPLLAYKAFPLKLGPKTFMTKFKKTMDPKEVLTGFDGYIALPCNVDMVGSTKKNDDGSPKYVNFNSVSGMSPKLAKAVDPLSGIGPQGHFRFNELTEEVIKMLNPIIHVRNILMESAEYPGSKAEAIIKKIRETDPDYATMSESEEEEPEDRTESEVNPPPPLDEQEEF